MISDTPCYPDHHGRLVTYEFLFSCDGVDFYRFIERHSGCAGYHCFNNQTVWFSLLDPAKDDLPDYVTGEAAEHLAALHHLLQ